MVARKPGLQSQTRTLLLALGCLILGLALGVYWYYRATKNTSPSVGETDLALSESTRTILRTLQTPVKINYYALLNSASTSDLLRAFAERVDQLLSEYEREAGGKITVVRHANRVDANTASADGIKPFNRDKGDVCYFGIVIVQNQRRESLPELAPEWEAAVEPDVTRAIIRVIGSQPAASSPMAIIQPDPAAIEDVKRAVPNLANVSLEEGTRILREAVLKDFAAAADEMDIRLKEAQQRVADAHGKPEAEQQAARKDLQRVQLEQAEKLKQVAARLQAQITALQQLKKE